MLGICQVAAKFVASGVVLSSIQLDSYEVDNLNKNVVNVVNIPIIIHWIIKNPTNENSHL
jgi:hypothetical protein